MNAALKIKIIGFVANAKIFHVKKIDKFFDTSDWRNEIINNLKQINSVGVKQFLSGQVKRVTELTNCAKEHGIKHCSQCKNWPCEKLGREPLIPE